MVSCSAPRLGLTESFIVIGIATISVIIYILCSFILFIKEEPHSSKARAQRNRPPKFLTNSGLLFCGIILVSIAFYVLSVAQLCTPNAPDIRYRFSRFIVLVFSLQRDTTQLVWFSQIHYILNRTTFRFHARCTMLFVAIFSVNIVTDIVNATVNDLDALLFWWSASMYLMQVAFLSGLFVSKLSTLYDHYKELPMSVAVASSIRGRLNRIHRRKSHDHLVQRVTRTVVLYFVSLGTILLTVTALTVILVANSQRHRIALEFVLHFVVLMDIFKARYVPKCHDD